MPNNGDDKKKKGSYRVSFGAFQPGSSTDFRQSNEFDVDWTPDQIAKYEGDMQAIDKYKAAFNEALYKKNKLAYKPDSPGFFSGEDTETSLAKDQFLTPKEAAAAAKAADLDIKEYYGAIRGMQGIVGSLNEGGLDFQLGFSGGKEGAQLLEDQLIGQQHLGQGYTGKAFVPEQKSFERPADAVFTRGVDTGSREYDASGRPIPAWKMQQQVPTTTQRSRIHSEEAAQQAIDAGSQNSYQGVQESGLQEGVSTQQHSLPGDMLRGINPGTTTFPPEALPKVAPKIGTIEDPHKKVFANGGPLIGEDGKPVPQAAPEFDLISQQSNQAAMRERFGGPEKLAPNAVNLIRAGYAGDNPYSSFEYDRGQAIKGEEYGDFTDMNKVYQEQFSPKANSFEGNYNPVSANPYAGPTSVYRPEVHSGGFAYGGNMPRQYGFGSNLAQGAGQVLSTLAPIAGMIPGVGTGVAAGAGALGAGLQNVGTGADMGEVIGESLAGGAQGAMGAFGMKSPMGMPAPTPGMNFGYGGGMRNRYAHGSEMTNTTVYNGNDHENGGIPLGNTGNEVEDGEVRWDAPDGEAYIFSNRLPYKK